MQASTAGSRPKPGVIPLRGGAMRYPYGLPHGATRLPSAVTPDHPMPTGQRMHAIVHFFIQYIHPLIQAVAPVLHEYGLVALVGILFIENMGLVFAPGESMVVAAGFLAGRGVLPPLPSAVAAIIATTLGSYLAWWLGDRYGHPFVIRYGRFVGVTPPRWEKAHRFFTRFGPAVVAGGRFVVPLRQLQGYVAGSAEMRFRSFALWSSLGAIVWVISWGGLAFWLADQIPVGH